VEVIEQAGRWAEPDSTGATYVEQLASADLSVGTYSLRAGAAEPGTVLYVPANESHHFHDIAEDLVLLVFFGPAYGSRSD
jgi:hypothetical protein